jgi:hypothetical protein
MPTRHGSMLENRASIWLRDNFGRSTIAPRSSRPTMWNDFLPISMPNSNRSLFCRRHGVLLVLASLVSLSMAGQEHGRKHPLAEVAQVV